MSITFEPHLVPAPVFQLQPLTSYVNDFWQYLDCDKQPALKDMRFLADAVVIPDEQNRNVLTLALSIEGFQVKEEGATNRFMALGCVTHFIMVDNDNTRLEFPRLLDIALPPFNMALGIVVGLARGHLLPRFQGSRWPNFILPIISVQQLSKAMKQRDKLRADGALEETRTTSQGENSPPSE
ncbi:hypothetical protein [Hymenobacter fodinae]|uniref:Preprotein translocase subunit SecB n=1 Tax=Hymenobacter fodinae TaxID=2510796 RepID=A0A4Z0NYS2_9BACT|nr:hypothetical protein [Hymenobacter fodinae]TGE03316.1 hypothetical protein EU556_25710 [Hymenobacter fodinae]